MEKIAQFWPENVEGKIAECRDNGQFAVVHDHDHDFGCWGECLVLNIPDDLRAELEANT